ncbi:hypothetical protein Lepto7376_3633 [[Leptolyngbya] sp. PCC 7376]|uniref:hypothetical protein n=1 Tax=[Leptolyngbya] sp. PCC 7376 TaxID=111781 RepID=UPI00029EE09C|nr:hypothetical protein [[Leptolyngbya] sp. PCC 7376]AFY39813.1 hypothetical protein Lepto7376_3633 [[Leptolyngbya] sp. PCC 7376]
MQDEDFEGPPTVWVVGTVIAGVLSGIGLVMVLEYFSDRLSPDQSCLSGQCGLEVVVENPSTQVHLKTDV